MMPLWSPDYPKTEWKSVYPQTLQIHLHCKHTYTRSSTEQISRTDQELLVEPNEKVGPAQWIRILGGYHIALLEDLLNTDWLLNLKYKQSREKEFPYGKSWMEERKEGMKDGPVQ